MKHAVQHMLILITSLILEGASPIVADEAPAIAIRLTGCRVKPASQVTLSVNQSGVLHSVPREGDRVDAGQQVILLEDELARASLALAEKEAVNDVETRSAEKASEVARLEHEQALQVNEQLKEVISISELRRAKLKFDTSLLQIEQARHKQAIAALKRDESAAQLKSFRVIAPFIGTVNKVLKYKGEAVRQGEPILELVNTRQLRVEGFLDVGSRRKVTAGDAVRVELEVADGVQADASAFGKIVFIDSIVQPVTQQVRIWAEVDNRDEVLLPGQTSVMTILPGKKYSPETSRP